MQLLWVGWRSVRSHEVESRGQVYRRCRTCCRDMWHMLGLDDRILFRTRGRPMSGTELFFSFWAPCGSVGGVANRQGLEPRTRALETPVLPIKLSTLWWSEMHDLNVRPSAPKADALPDCANLGYKEPLSAILEMWEGPCCFDYSRLFYIAQGLPLHRMAPVKNSVFP